MERVTGIGGFFFVARDPEALQAWYAEHLGVPSPSWTQEAGETAFAVLAEPLDSFPAGATWGLNFRVRDLAAMVAQLRGAGIEVAVDPESYPFGVFAQLLDPEGNPVQLWEPRD